MKIEWLGHACFRLDESLVIDPYKDGSVPGLAPLKTTANKVICSHGHADHSGIECVEIILGDCGFEIEEIPCWHDDQQGALRGPNTIFVITKNGEKLVHLGDLGHFPTDEQLEKIKDADYFLVPVGGYYTFAPEVAVKVCEVANPKQIIPMHYRTTEYGYPEVGTNEEFLKLVEEAGLKGKIKT